MANGFRFAPSHIPLFKKFSTKPKVTKLKIAQPKFPKLKKL